MKKLLKLINESVGCLEHRNLELAQNILLNRKATNSMHDHISVALADIHEEFLAIKNCLNSRPQKKRKNICREEITLDGEAQWRSVHMDSKIPSAHTAGHFFYEWTE